MLLNFLTNLNFDHSDENAFYAVVEFKGHDDNSFISSIRFYCMNCGYEHRKNACPKCGSKAVRVR
jgi:rubrerythrin